MSSANRLLAKFPKIVPSYEKILNKKEHSATVFSIIPKGVKSYLWFTYFEDKNVCCMITLDNKKKIRSIDYRPMCFSSNLSMGQYGTILYGTSFYSSSETGCKVKCFSCEDIIYYIGKKMEWNSKSSFLTSNELVDLFTYQIKQVLYNKNFIICGLPIITRQFSIAYDHIKNLPYNAYGIQQRNSYGHLIGMTIVNQTTSGEHSVVEAASSPFIGNKPNVCNINNINKTEIIFRVRPSLHPDIYELYCLGDNKTECFYGIAMIPSYKSSVFMNQLFRNIKENSNLDLLEESDDEEEFQNNREDKFVDLEKSLLMNCVFNKRFGKWQPIKVVVDKMIGSLTTKNEVLLFEQNT